MLIANTMSLVKNILNKDSMSLEEEEALKTQIDLKYIPLEPNHKCIFKVLYKNQKLVSYKFIANLENLKLTYALSNKKYITFVEDHLQETQNFSTYDYIIGTIKKIEENQIIVEIKQDSTDGLYLKKCTNGCSYLKLGTTKGRSFLFCNVCGQTNYCKHYASNWYGCQITF